MAGGVVQHTKVYQCTNIPCRTGEWHYMYTCEHVLLITRWIEKRYRTGEGIVLIYRRRMAAEMPEERKFPIHVIIQIIELIVNYLRSYLSNYLLSTLPVLEGVLHRSLRGYIILSCSTCMCMHTSFN